MDSQFIQARFALQLGRNDAGFDLDVDLSIPATGTSAIFGESGAGKTTLLRCIAGLQPCPGGRLIVGGDIWQDDTRCLPAHRRPLGYVFQQPGLFEHLDVRGNLRFAMRRANAASRVTGFDDVVQMMALDALLDSRVQVLSGGEQQRVAIARALLSQPRLLLLDEPLAALDAARKREILPYLERLSREACVPILYVSHSLDEVMRLADHAVLLKHGRLVRSGPVVEVLGRQDGQLEADRASVVLETVVAGTDANWALTRATFAGGELWLDAGTRVAGDRLRVRIFGSDVSVARSAARDSSIVNILPATITAIADSGSSAKQMVTLALGDSVLLAELTRRSVTDLALQVGEPVWAQVKSAAIVS